MNKERLFEILMSDNVVESINENLNEVLRIIPEIKDMIGFEHNNPHHHLDVWEHTLLALELSPKDFEIRLVLLLHDIGKPHSYQELRGRHFKGHPDMSSKISYNILRRLNFSEDEIDELCYLIKMHDTLITDKEINSDSLLTQKRFKIQFCDGMAHHPEKLERRRNYLLSINEKINSGIEKEEYESLILNTFNNNKVKKKEETIN